MTEPKEPWIFRLKDVADVLGVPVGTARRMCEEGVIPSRKLGGRIVVLPDELTAHLHALPRRNEQAASSTVGRRDEAATAPTPPNPDQR